MSKWETTKNHWSKTEKREEIRKKISEKLKGRPAPDSAFKKGGVSPMKGRKKTPEQIERWKRSRIKGKGFKAWNKGILGSTTGPKGIVRGEEWKKNLSESLKGREVWNKGMGVDRGLRFLVNSSSKYANWRKSIFERDGYKCIWCGITGKLEVDHIKSFARIMIENKITSLELAFDCEELWDLNNGRTLCKPCHKTTDTHGGKTRAKNIK